jgi:hypothetical protein
MGRGSLLSRDAQSRKERLPVIFIEAGLIRVDSKKLSAHSKNVGSRRSPKRVYRRRFRKCRKRLERGLISGPPTQNL